MLLKGRKPSRIHMICVNKRLFKNTESVWNVSLFTSFRERGAREKSRRVRPPVPNWNPSRDPFSYSHTLLVLHANQCTHPRRWNHWSLRRLSSLQTSPSCFIPYPSDRTFPSSRRMASILHRDSRGSCPIGSRASHVAAHQFGNYGTSLSTNFQLIKNTQNNNNHLHAIDSSPQSYAFPRHRAQTSPSCHRSLHSLPTPHPPPFLPTLPPHFLPHHASPPWPPPSHSPRTTT